MKFCMFVLSLIVWIFPMLLSAQNQTVGVFLNTESSYNGYTLFSNNREAYLIDNCGLIVNKWNSEYRPGISTYLLEDGNLLRTARINGDFNGGGLGGRFELFSWEGDLIWSYEIANSTSQAHHDIAPMKNGNFLAIVWDKMSAAEAQAAGRNITGEVWLEKIVEVKMLGTNQAEIVWEWKLRNHLVQDVFSDKLNFGSVSENYGKLDFNYKSPGDNGVGDWIHCNAIDYNEDLDQIVLSSRNLSEIWVIDHSTTTEEASISSGGNAGRGGDFLYRYGNPQVYQRGGPEDQKFFNQHDIEWVDGQSEYEGDLTVFNNNYMPGKSRVERWSPPLNGFNYDLSFDEAFGPSEPNWSYTDDGFFSGRISGLQILPNENILICEGDEGHFFEITEEGELVWDYINPVNSNGFPVLQGGTPLLNSTFRTIRYPPDYMGFENKDLSPTVPVELAPKDFGCMIYLSSGFQEDKPIGGPTIIQNPIQERLYIENKMKNVQAIIVNSMGKTMKSLHILEGLNDFDISTFQSGIYFLRFENGAKYSALKIIKL